MPQEYDTQLLESVAVRRRRLQEVLLFGPERRRRTLTKSITKIFIGMCIAAVLCAGLVGWSFIKNRMMQGTGAPAQPMILTPTPSGR